jgi:hypothetical protein
MKFGPTLEELRGEMPSTVRAPSSQVLKTPKMKPPFRESGTALLLLILAIVCGPALVIWIVAHFGQMFLDSLSMRELFTFFACVVAYLLFLILLAIKEVSRAVSKAQEASLELTELTKGLAKESVERTGLTRELARELEWYKAGTLGHELVDELRSIASSNREIQSDISRIG